MSITRFTPWVALVCMSALAACTSDEGGTAGNTELNVIVPNNQSSPGVPAPIDITTVEYTINCLGNSEVFLENLDSFPDEVRLEGNLEVVDDRTDPQGAIPPEFGTPRPGDGAEVWQTFMDLPPGPCTIQLRARDNDGEVICTATEPFTITADTTAKVNLVLVCDVSYQAPVGMLDVDATFSFVVGNFCPDLFVLNCLSSNPELIDVGLPFLVAATACEFRARDGDSGCGGAGEDSSCDPQTCSVTPQGISCIPDVPDPGTSTTVTCSGGGARQLDCDFDPLTTDAIFDGVNSVCVYDGDQLGVIPVNGPIVPNIPGGLVPGANGAFALSCLTAVPGATITCTAETTDGDLDCNKVKTVSITCPGLLACDQYAADGFVCDDGNSCTADACDNAGAVGGSCGSADNGSCCTTTDLPAGDSCTDAAPPAVCDGAGNCNSLDCNAQANPDLSCDDGNECTVNTCDAPPATTCSTANVGSGASCDAGAGASSGACDGAGACTDICSFNPACPDDAGNVCNTGSCDPADGTCSLVNANEGGVCDSTGPGSADGVCQTGTCIFAPPGCNESQTGSALIPQVGIVSVGCTNSVTTAQSPFPFTLEVDVPDPVLAGGDFTASFDGIGVFPEFFLDAAQGVVPGGVAVAELVDIVSTVQVRSGASGADVPLLADTGSLTPGAVLTCDIPAGQVCLVDLDCAGGFGSCNIPVVLADLPTSTDCAVGGECDLLGKAGVGSQCDLNGFCITGDLIIEFLNSGPQPFTAGGSGSVLFGWSDGVGAGTTPVPGLVLCPAAAPSCTDPFMPDGCYDIPAAVFSDPTAPIGIRVNASGLFVPIQCAQADPGGICASGEGCLVDGDCATAPCTITTDVVCPTPDAGLISCPVL